MSPLNGSTSEASATLECVPSTPNGITAMENYQ